MQKKRCVCLTRTCFEIPLKTRVQQCVGTCVWISPSSDTGIWRGGFRELKKVRRQSLGFRVEAHFSLRTSFSTYYLCDLELTTLNFSTYKAVIKTPCRTGWRIKTKSNRACGESSMAFSSHCMEAKIDTEVPSQIRVGPEQSLDGMHTAGRKEVGHLDVG